MKQKLVKFDSEKLRSLIQVKHDSIEDFRKSLTEAGHPVTRAAIQLWLIGRPPRIEALYAIASHFNEPMENFLSRNIP